MTQLHGKAISPADIAAAEAAAAVAAEAAAAAAAAGGKAGKKGKAKQAAQLSAKQLKQQQAAAAAAAAAAAGSDGGTVLWARHVSGEGALVKKWRLILRNLAFQVTGVFAVLRGANVLLCLLLLVGAQLCGAEEVILLGGVLLWARTAAGQQQHAWQLVATFGAIAPAALLQHARL